MGGLSEIEFDTTRQLFGINLNDPDTQAFLRLYGLIPTKEQHQTLLKLKEMDVP